ncbi:TetR family transcriptional regulator [Caldicellulosiruptor bescii]|uniref:Transcriptional regulator, TetR family n=2 Tax=Caldicellulosiruptor bescii TaxID=31899 RepID=B9MJV6_CALBD|nr:TetR/AcrR family transcriptional regulator [Caldicellulosiruptor bescii]ACM60614.1 transcriptional regulator, TetR family [Caldicellulosiruptor bescii DSM 6725]PBC88023.1 TetR family transcriptional regulator [Caldicellulosiruptor bescii]PBC90955.1 TetR family transcriptional regulator [Caldicellulosiruptor bescii]PBD03612.1 TetR family transcriptional regulator [Caldicellulosiruptor bescii]PBD06753.1 TetR family transcriptional regulator [Caldicellulosiruptor bescii]
MKKSEVTKNKIIQTAIKLISQNGYAATTTAQIAKEAGVSEATLFKYFKDKETLLKEVIKAGVTQILSQVALLPLKENIKKSMALKTPDFIKSLICERLEMAEKNIDIFKVVLIEIQYNDLLKKEVSEKMVPKTCQSKQLIERILMQKADISSDMAKGLSRVIIGTVLTFLIQKYILGIETSEDELDREINNVLLVFKKAIGEE